MAARERMTAPDFVVPFCAEEPVVLHSDSDVLLVEKPAGLLSVPGRHPLNRDCLISRLQLHWPQALIVHRLDMDTSGIMVVALNRETHASLSRQFQQRQVFKQYEAIVHGLVAEDSGEVKLPLITDWPNRPLQKVCPVDGKPALTRFQVLHRDPDRNLSHLLLTPETGRSHQLRVHMKTLGHPILGDTFYGDKETRAMASRLLLHATRLELLHPGTGEFIRGLSPSALEKFHNAGRTL